MNLDKDSEAHCLEVSQVERLHEVLSEIYVVDGGVSLPTLHVRPKDLIRAIVQKLQPTEIFLKDVRLNGSAASVVLVGDSTNDTTDNSCGHFSDIDLLFHVDFDITQASVHFDTLLATVMETLKTYFPEDLQQHVKNIPNNVLASMYVSKLVKVPNYHTQATKTTDVWSLISLRNDCGRNVELKFVSHMRRQCEFSMDSFQVILNDDILQYESDVEDMQLPSVYAVSIYGDYKTALSHLGNGIICIDKPEEVRGGGLLKYCRLLTRDYDHPEELTDRDISKIECIMCTRFFIDFPTADLQYNTLTAHLRTHHFRDKESVLRFLEHLYVAIANYSREEQDRVATLDMIRFVQYSIKQAPELIPPTEMQSTPHGKKTRHIPLVGHTNSNHGHLPPCITIFDPSFPDSEPETDEQESSLESPASFSSEQCSIEDDAYPSPPATPDMKVPVKDRDLPIPTSVILAASCERNDKTSCTTNPSTVSASFDVMLTPLSSASSSDCGSSVGDDSLSERDDDEPEPPKTGPKPTMPRRTHTREEKEEAFSRCRQCVAQKDDLEGLLREIEMGIISVDDFGFFGNANSSGQTLLMVAAKHGRLKCVTALVDKLGAQVNQAGGMGKYTALHYAAYHGHAEIVQALLQRGADVHMVTEEGETAEKAASVKGNKWVVEYIQAWRTGKPLPPLPTKKSSSKRNSSASSKSRGKDSNGRNSQTPLTRSDKPQKHSPRSKSQHTYSHSREKKDNHHHVQSHKEREGTRYTKERVGTRPKAVRVVPDSTTESIVGV